MNSYITQDLEANRGNWKSCCVVWLFRLAQRVHRWPHPWRWFGLPVLIFYELFVMWELGIDLSYKATIGPGLSLYHSVGLVVHESVIIGKNCTLRQCTTIGMRNEPDDCPVIGNDVDIGSNSVLIGRIRIGDGAVIGAGSVVLHDVAPGDVVAGNPARSIRKVA